jgi:hypothetical protein
MILTFGKYKGQDITKIPSQYLAWLMNPIIQGKEYPVPQEIKEEAVKIYEQKKIEENYLKYRLNGYIGNKTEYIIERLGDLEIYWDEEGYHQKDTNLSIHNSLEEALQQLEKEFPMQYVEASEYTDNKARLVRSTPDPEDDRILIWEVLENGHKKVVWHFSGWHWDCEEFPGLDQGKLPSDNTNLYSLAMEDY